MITLPRAERPVVSVVMVTYGGRAWAERSLSALSEHAEAPLEVIVVDNASPDGTGPWLTEHVRGATVLLNARNAGFASASNRGAAHARGRYVCFLNPDAMVEEGWLEPIIEVLERDPTAAAVCPRLLNLDRSLQEAGSVVGREGATYALGWGQDPKDLQFRFPLQVDFASAACLLVRRSAFCEVGGFDAAYSPAYVEDVDLCLALSKRGYRTVYEPSSSVLHARSVSAGVEGAERWIREHRALLVRRRWPQLTSHWWLQEPKFFPHRVAAARDHHVLGRLLVVAGRVPPPGSALREALEELAAWEHVRTTLVAQAAEGGEPLARMGIEVVVGPRDWEDWFEGRRYHFTAILLADGGDGFASSLAATQPHLVPSRLDAERHGDLAELMAGLGVAPPATVPGVVP